MPRKTTSDIFELKKIGRTKYIAMRNISLSAVIRLNNKDINGNGRKFFGTFTESLSCLRADNRCV
jgi:hypothetical protein